MSREYYPVGIPDDKVQAALDAINGLIVPANNGKVLAVENATLVAKSVTDYTSHTLQAKTGVSFTQNGSFTITPDSGFDGMSSVSGTVAVPDVTAIPVVRLTA